MAVFAISAATSGAWALPPESLDSVVSVLPLWPGHARGGTGDPMADAPEGSGIVIEAGGYIATAAHVVDRATDIQVRLSNGLVLAATAIASDPATDIAVLKIDLDAPVFERALPPALGEPVCAIANQFGLDLSVTCGVVSAVNRAGTGFNIIEDFIQTDATVNPGASGGALVDMEGRLVGMLSAIFTRQSDADIGVNFAVSARLLDRVAQDLIAYGKVVRGRPGVRVAPLDEAARGQFSGVRVIGVSENSAAAGAGIRSGDIITAIDRRKIRTESDILSAFHLNRPGQAITVSLIRDGELFDATFILDP
ncbi:MAG: PDZ domain-containing protein [Alphaproteobacteria bacterium]|nr:PDZ domain-containing protein [Alphaproteobacteria bacterium]